MHWAEITSSDWVFFVTEKIAHPDDRVNLFRREARKQISPDGICANGKSVFQHLAPDPGEHYEGRSAIAGQSLDELPSLHSA